MKLGEYEPLSQSIPRHYPTTLIIAALVCSTAAAGPEAVTCDSPCDCHDAAMPSAEERAEMRALDAKLDALAAKLKG